MSSGTENSTITPAENGARSLYWYVDGDWEHSAADIEELPLPLREKVSEVSMSFVKATPNGQPDFNYIDFPSAKKARELFPRADIALALAGGSESGNDRAWNTVLAQPEQFIPPLINTARNLGASAIKLDYEGPIDNPDTYLDFVAKTSEALGEEGLAMGVAANVAVLGHSTEYLQQLADSAVLEVMTYDQYGPWSREIGPVSATDWTVDSMRHFTERGIDPARLSVGVPFYGYTYRGKRPGKKAQPVDEGIRNVEIEKLQAGTDWAADQIDGASYLINKNSSEIISFVSSDDISERLHRLGSLGITNAFGWHAGQLTPSSLEVFVS